MLTYERAGEGDDERKHIGPTRLLVAAVALGEHVDVREEAVLAHGLKTRLCILKWTNCVPGRFSVH